MDRQCLGLQLPGSYLLSMAWQLWPGTYGLAPLAWHLWRGSLAKAGREEDHAGLVVLGQGDHLGGRL